MNKDQAENSEACTEPNDATLETKAKQGVNTLKLQRTKLPLEPFWLEKVYPNAEDVFKFESLSQNEIKSECNFAFDTNILLAPYEFGSKNFADLEKIYKTLSKSSRLYVPAQAAREFAKHRGAKIAAVYQKIITKNNQLSNEKLISPILEGIAEFDRANRLIDDLRPKLEELSTAFADLKETVQNWGWTDKVSSLYRLIFTKETIIERSNNDPKCNSEILANLAFRYSHEVPPGYKDANKEDGGIGDYLIWLSLIALGREKRKSVVFVSNDQKSDWWIRNQNAPVIPRTELLLEFYRLTEMKIGFMKWQDFLSIMGATPETVQEASIVQSQSSIPKGELSIMLNYIAQILQNYHDNYGARPDSEDYINESEFDGLAAIASEVARAVHSPNLSSRTIDVLHKLVELLRAIEKENYTIRYALIRQKFIPTDAQKVMDGRITLFLSIYYQNREHFSML